MTTVPPPPSDSHFRALPDLVGFSVHGGRRCDWQSAAGLDRRAEQVAVRPGIASQYPIGVLLWLMIFPMMLKVDFSTIGGIARKQRVSW